MNGSVECAVSSEMLRTMLTNEKRSYMDVLVVAYFCELFADFRVGAALQMPEYLTQKEEAGLSRLRREDIARRVDHGRTLRE